VELSASWLTPVEIFRPWYAQALARYILRQHQERCFAQGDASIPLLVYEVSDVANNPHNDIPQRGDDSRTGLVTLLARSATAASRALITSRRRVR